MADPLPSLPSLRMMRCACGVHRRAFGLALLAGAAAPPVWARGGVSVGEQSRFSKLVPADQVEQAAIQQYGQLLAQARQQGALAPPEHPQVVRLRAIAQRIIPFTAQWNPRSRQWRWEVNLLGGKQINQPKFDS